MKAQNTETDPRYANNRDAGEQSASRAMTLFRELVQSRFLPAFSGRCHIVTSVLQIY